MPRSTLSLVALALALAIPTPAPLDAQPPGRLPHRLPHRLPGWLPGTPSRSDRAASADERMRRDLTSGRLVVSGVRFAHGSARLGSASTGAVEQLAAALRRTTGVFVVETRVPPSVAGGRTLSGRRAAALRARLVAAGVERTRLIAAGMTGDDGIAITRQR